MYVLYTVFSTEPLAYVDILICSQLMSFSLGPPPSTSLAPSAPAAAAAPPPPRRTPCPCASGQPAPSRGLASGRPRTCSTRPPRQPPPLSQWPSRRVCRPGRWQREVGRVERRWNKISFNKTSFYYRQQNFHHVLCFRTGEV